ncbi:hypothetical protein A0H81_13809 [Grifola frondosa]|uniref:F-box domain-containing protein n=1 Tax=Grifola frondosa TaxID=5627 RepID=A0A1C7LQK7_GRIFR|nr:hypothetical protein A0H81_13809 [Grifola frondosa]
MEPHRALFCCDILDEIFQHLSPEDEADAIKGFALRRAACVSRTFYGFASDVLWRKVHTTGQIRHLLITLGIAEEVGCQYRGVKLVKCQKISDKSLLRFRQYAARVRSITPKIISDEDWLSLCPLSGHGKLMIFPNLQSVKVVFSGSPSMLKLRSLLITPSLRDLSVECASREACESGMRATFNEVCSAVPSLESVTVGILSRPDLLSPILRLSHLSKLDLMVSMNGNRDLLRSLSTRKNITSLFLRFKLEPHHGDFSICGFASLHELGINGTLQNAKTMLAGLESRYIESVTVDVLTAKNRVDDLQDCLEPLRRHHGSLRRLKFSVLARYGSKEDTLINAIAPVMKMKRLREIKLEFPGWKLRCSQQEFRKIAEAWPDVRSLALKYDLLATSPCVPRGSVVDLGSVFYLAQRCRKLEKLQLEFVACPKPISLGEHPRCTLRELHINNIFGIEPCGSDDIMRDLPTGPEDYGGVAGGTLPSIGISEEGTRGDEIKYWRTDCVSSNSGRRNARQWFG